MNDKEKQIEEMAVLGCGRTPQAHTPEECSKCPFDERNCMAKRQAKALYNAGYRKVGENERIITNDEFWKLSNKFSKKELDDISKFRKEQAVKEFYKEAKENFDWYCSRHGSLDGEDCEKILDETLKEVIGGNE